jgi:hypothetical protein
MTPVYQRTGAKTGEPGDCFAACMASVLDMGLASVPNFNISSTNGEPVTAEDTERLRVWLAPRGYVYAEFGFHIPTIDIMLVHLGNVVPDTTYFLIGRTNTYRIHCVVAKGGVIMHDPATRAGEHSIRGPCHDGYWRVGLFLWNR